MKPDDDPTVQLSRIRERRQDETMADTRSWDVTLAPPEQARWEQPARSSGRRLWPVAAAVIGLLLVGAGGAAAMTRRPAPIGQPAISAAPTTEGLTTDGPATGGPVGAAVPAPTKAGSPADASPADVPASDPPPPDLPASDAPAVDLPAPDGPAVDPPAPDAPGQGQPGGGGKPRPGQKGRPAAPAAGLPVR